MHNLEIEKLVMQRLITFAAFDKTRMARVNVNFTPPTTGIWIRPSILPTSSKMTGMSNKPCIREIGFVVIEVFDRENVGTGALKDYVDKLGEYMQLIQLGKLDLLEASCDDAGFDEVYKMYKLIIRIPYRYN